MKISNRIEMKIKSVQWGEFICSESLYSVPRKTRANANRVFWILNVHPNNWTQYLSRSLRHFWTTNISTNYNSFYKFHHSIASVSTGFQHFFVVRLFFEIGLKLNNISDHRHCKDSEISFWFLLIWVAEWEKYYCIYKT